MRQISGRLPSPSLVVAFLALLVALGGGAYAAVNSGGGGAVYTCYLKGHGDLRVVSAKAKCSKNEKALVLNRQGVPGAAGSTGASGPQGAKGDTGPRGPSAAFSVRNPSQVLTFTSLPVASLDLAAGSYVISTTLWVRGLEAGSFASGLICSLVAAGDSDSSQVQVYSENGLAGIVPVSLSLTHSGTSPFTATLSCSKVGSATVTALDTELTAIEVGSLTVQP